MHSGFVAMIAACSLILVGCGENRNLAQGKLVGDGKTVEYPAVNLGDISPVLGDEPLVFMWQVQQDAPDGDFEYLARTGVTAVQAFRLVTWSDEVVRAYLDGASRENLAVAVYLGIYRVGDDADCHYSAEAIEFMRKHGSHEAIFAWHLIDEPAEHKISKECQRALYRAVKEIDPERPVMISANNNTRSKYRRYFAEDAFDILEMHKYVNPRPGSRAQNLLDLFREHRTRDYPVIITLRAYNSPHKPRRKPMVPGSLQEQYEFFIEQGDITEHVGFYGWDLAPNVGIKALPELRSEFEAFMSTKTAADE